MIVLVCFLRPAKLRIATWDFIFPLILLVLLCVTLWMFRRVEAPLNVFLIAFSVSMLASYFLVERPVKFGLAVLAVLVAGILYPSEPVKTLRAQRNFFGVLRVMADRDEKLHILLHGTTTHGMQLLDSSMRCEPMGYYHRGGPFGSIATTLQGQPSPRVAVVGLGAGATASYAEPGHEWTFYEIDPAVINIARNPAFFSYLDGCAKGPIKYVLGDGRLRLKEVPDGYYSLIALDAFSSDAIPLHLLTREAVELYMSKLNNTGLLAFHISNRHMNLAVPLASIAKSYGLSGMIMRDEEITAEESATGKEPSIWVVMSRKPEDMKGLPADKRWTTLDAPADFRVWTDDFSNIFSVLWR
jgi:hypothetical protein